MKKAFLLLVPLTICLASCEKMIVGYTSSQFSSAFIDRSRSSNQNNPTSYEFSSGDIITEEGKNVAHITFDFSNKYSNISVTDLTPLVSCDVPGLINEITDASNVGVKEEEGLFIGADSSYVDGYLTITFNSEIKDILIKACPYYYILPSFEEEIKTDLESGFVAVAVNNSRYIRLSTPINENANPRELKPADERDTDCSFNLPTGTNEITIKVGQRRAFIRNITLYY